MLVGSQVRRVAIIGGLRIPFARAYGAYAAAGNQDMLTETFRAVVQRFKLNGEHLGDVIAGAVIKHSRDYNLVRESVLSSGLAPSTPGLDIQRACGTSLEAAILVGNKIALGQMEAGIAGGVDSISDPPIVYPRSYQQLLLRSYMGRSAMARIKPLFGLRPRHFKPVMLGVVEPRTGLTMGQSMELTAQKWHITRAAQDELAYDSHRKAAAAWKEGFYEDLVVPFRGLATDNNIRADTSTEKLAKLRPVFDLSDRGHPHGRQQYAADRWRQCRTAGLRGMGRAGMACPVLAYLSYGKVWAVDFVSGAEGLLMAPAYAVAAMLKDAGLGLADFDYYELHEAFAAQVLATLAAWESDEYCRDALKQPKALGSINRARLNVKGGSVALGHPFAATGTRIVASLAKILAADRTAKRGLVSVCTAGGMGVTAILERA